MVGARIFDNQVAPFYARAVAPIYMRTTTHYCPSASRMYALPVVAIAFLS